MSYDNIGKYREIQRQRQQQAAVPMDEIDQLEQTRKTLPPSWVPGWAEVPATLASGMASSAAGGLAGLGTAGLNALGLSKANPADVVQSFQQDYTYLPRTVEGMAATHAAGKAFEALHAPVARAADMTLGATGSPALATAVDVGPTALGALMGLPGGLGNTARGALRSIIPDIAPSYAANPFGAGVAGGQEGALFGIKRHPRYWHGVSGGADVARAIAREGQFSEGRSAELSLPGTSLSGDPLLSYKSFANSDPNAMLRVKTDIPPSEVRNLSPVDYLTGKVPDVELYRKPNLFFKEDETFARRRSNTDPEAWARLADARESLSLRQKTLKDMYESHGLTVDVVRKQYPDVAKQLDELWLESLDLAKQKRSLQEQPPRLFPQLLDDADAEYLASHVRNLNNYNQAVLDVGNRTRPPQQALNAWHSALGALGGNRAAYNRVLAATAGESPGSTWNRNTINPPLELDYADMAQAADFLDPRYRLYRSSLGDLSTAKRHFKASQVVAPDDPQANLYLLNTYRQAVKAREGYTQGLEDIFKGRIGHYRK
jgi:hypothetical protein